MTAVVGEKAEAASGDDHNLLAHFYAAVAVDLRLFALLHRQELDRDTLNALCEGGFPQGLGLNLHSDQASEALHVLKQAMKTLASVRDQTAPDNGLDNGLDDALDDLAADFANIYLTNGYRASPYESVWRDEEQLERQLPMFEISQIYRQYELQAADRNTMPEDHLSLQLEFIAHLMDLELTQGQDSKQMQKAAEFMDEHLLLWLDEFARRIASRCATPFYAGLVALSAAYINELRDHLAHLTGQPRADLTEQTLPSGNAQAEEAEISLQYVPGAAPSW